jgi:hypothetical protein
MPEQIIDGLILTFQEWELTDPGATWVIYEFDPDTYVETFVASDVDPGDWEVALGIFDTNEDGVFESESVVTAPTDTNGFYILRAYQEIETEGCEGSTFSWKEFAINFTVNCSDTLIDKCFYRFEDVETRENNPFGDADGDSLVDGDVCTAYGWFGIDSGGIIGGVDYGSDSADWKAVNAVDITAWVTEENVALGDFTLQGSSDGSTWSDFKTLAYDVEDWDPPNRRRVIYFDTPNQGVKLRHWRINMALPTSSPGWLYLAELKFGIAIPEDIEHEISAEGISESEIELELTNLTDSTGDFREYFYKIEYRQVTELLSGGSWLTHAANQIPGDPVPNLTGLSATSIYEIRITPFIGDCVGVPGDSAFGLTCVEPPLLTATTLPTGFIHVSRGAVDNASSYILEYQKPDLSWVALGGDDFDFAPGEFDGGDTVNFRAKAIGETLSGPPPLSGTYCDSTWATASAIAPETINYSYFDATAFTHQNVVNNGDFFDFPTSDEHYLYIIGTSFPDNSFESYAYAYKTLEVKTADYITVHPNSGLTVSALAYYHTDDEEATDNKFWVFKRNMEAPDPEDWFWEEEIEPTPIGAIVDIGDWSFNNAGGAGTIQIKYSGDADPAERLLFTDFGGSISQPTVTVLVFSETPATGQLVPIDGSWVEIQLDEDLNYFPWAAGTPTVGIYSEDVNDWDAIYLDIETLPNPYTFYVYGDDILESNRNNGIALRNYNVLAKTVEVSIIDALSYIEALAPNNVFFIRVSHSDTLAAALQFEGTSSSGESSGTSDGSSGTSSGTSSNESSGTSSATSSGNSSAASSGTSSDASSISSEFSSASSIHSCSFEVSRPLIEIIYGTNTIKITLSQILPGGVTLKLLYKKDDMPDFVVLDSGVTTGYFIIFAPDECSHYQFKWQVE